MIDFGREVCDNLAASGTQEWLVTNGIGGYASGTISGLLTRRYHGLLIAALKPPLGQTLLLTKLDETAIYDGRTYPLFANRWADGLVEPAGFHHLECFHLEGTTPVWAFACADALLEKRVWMQPGANTTYIHYLGGGCPGLWPGMNPPKLRSCDEWNHEVDYWHDGKENQPYSLRHQIPSCVGSQVPQMDLARRYSATSG